MLKECREEGQTSILGKLNLQRTDGTVKERLPDEATLDKVMRIFFISLDISLDNTGVIVRVRSQLILGNRALGDVQ